MAAYTSCSRKLPSLISVSILIFLSVLEISGQRDTSDVYSVSSTHPSSPQTEIVTGITWSNLSSANTDISCNQYLREFSSSSSSFVECASTHAKPVKLCEKCSDQYTSVFVAAQYIQNNDNCRDKILNSDILRIVQTTHDFVTDLWINGQCDRCYGKDYKPEKKPTYGEFSNETNTFIELYNKTQECFNRNKTMMGLAEAELNTENTICKQCDKVYCKLNKYYQGMLPVSTICIDIVEMMNSTRQQWSKEFKCIRHEKDLKVVVSVCSFLSCLPVIFYLAAKALSKRKVITKEDLSTSGRNGQQYISTFGSNRR